MAAVKTSILAALVGLTLTLSACGSDNTDPRMGRVDMDGSNCLTGECFDFYKFCIGPDLHVIYDEMGDDDYSRTFTNSQECAP